MATPPDPLLQRAEYAVAANRKLRAERKRICAQMAKLADRWAAGARQQLDWVKHAEQRVAEAGSIGVRSGGLVSTRRTLCPDQPR
jgi:hypothetical protein